LIAAHASDTVHTKLYDVGWPDAAHRVIRTPVFEAWERAGSPVSGNRPGEGELSARMRRPEFEVPLVKYSVMAPTDYIEGDIGGLAFYAGQSVSYVRGVEGAGDIVQKIANEARDVIASRLAPLVR
jgi:NAD(P)H-dependent flavin oxidoreductase YrpB (nitropropane dioxygenase family)